MTPPTPISSQKIEKIMSVWGSGIINKTDPIHTYTGLAMLRFDQRESSWFLIPPEREDFSIYCKHTFQPLIRLQRIPQDEKERYP